MTTALEQPIAPQVNSGAVERLLSLLQAVSVQIGIINANLGTMHGVPSGLTAPGRFAPLHDGPETH